MAGIGIRLNKIYSGKSLTAHLYGFLYSSAITLLPMFVVIGAIIVGQLLLGFSEVNYLRRELFADTILYIFIFSLLICSPYNSVLSRYLSDIIFEENYAAIRPCYYMGLLLNVVTGTLLSVPFCLHEHFVGEVPVYYVFTGYCGFMALTLVFYSMLYLSIAKSYSEVSLFFTNGMVLVLPLSWVFSRLLGMEASYALLLGMTVGFTLIAGMEIALILSYFKDNDGSYTAIFPYMFKHWKTLLVNGFYTLGLYIHNFVFWQSPLRSVLVRSFVTAPSYDMATCLAMFTNITETMIYISRVEMYFRDRYRDYIEAVIGGRGHDIESAKRRMFRQLAVELMSLTRLQFFISVIVFLVFMIVMPMLGYGGLTMRIYPCLCVGYFILFIMYAEILFMYYFNDTDGALLSSIVFCLVTCLGSLFSSRLDEIWYGLGLVLGAFAGFTTAYYRLRWIERNIDVFMFCQGDIIPRDKRPRPSSVVYRRETS